MLPASYSKHERNLVLTTFTQTIMHLVYPLPCQILHNHCFQFLPGNTGRPPPRYYDQDSMVQPWLH